MRRWTFGLLSRRVDGVCSPGQSADSARGTIEVALGVVQGARSSHSQTESLAIRRPIGENSGGPQDSERFLSAFPKWRVFTSVKSMTDTQQLLAEYAKTGSEEAFR